MIYMSEHPIEGLMLTAMNSIRDMVDVNTIIGEPIETSNNIVIIPISKVGFGFASGGSEFNVETINEYTKKDKDEQIQYKLPFGGGSGAGVTLNPHTPVSVLEDIINDVDMVLLMSVNPGFGGQKFIEHSFKKTKALKELIERNNSKALIQIDGGVCMENASKLYEAGADCLVAGSAVFSSNDILKTIDDLKK